MSGDEIKYIIARLVDKANANITEARADRNDLFKEGKSLAYYEMLDVLQSELTVAGEDLEEYGLNVDLLRRFI